jgi:hypothetical protein
LSARIGGLLGTDLDLDLDFDSGDHAVEVGQDLLVHLGDAQVTGGFGGAEQG